MIGSTSCQWAWTQSSRPTPTSLMHIISFTSRFDITVVLEFYLENTRRVWLVKTFGFSQIRGRHRFNPSGILVTYTTSFKSKYTSSKAKHGWPSKGYNFTKGNIYRWKGSQGYWIWCRMKSNNGSDDPQRSWCEYRYSLRGRKNAEASDSRITWLVWCINRKKLWFPNQMIRGRHSDQGWIDWKHLVGQSIKVWINENQLMSKMTSKSERWFF